MAKKKTTRERIREEVRADKDRYDRVTRELEAVIEKYRRRTERRDAPGS
jgi:hypothetical protein